MLIPVSAHELQTNNKFGVILHIDPDDDPVAGQTAVLTFKFEDKKNKFTSSGCLCSVRILENNTHEVYAQKLKSESFSYVFPESGNYTVQASGKPINEENFIPFTVNFDIYVNKNIKNPEIATKAVNKTSSIPPVIIMIPVLLLTIFLLKRLNYKKNTE